jgi:hypothetical protein
MRVRAGSPLRPDSPAMTSRRSHASAALRWCDVSHFSTSGAPSQHHGSVRSRYRHRNGYSDGSISERARIRPVRSPGLHPTRDDHHEREAGMPPALLCPSCAEPGHLIGHDRKMRAQYACPTEGCDVLEFDRDLILLRKGGTWSLLRPPPRPFSERRHRVSDKPAVHTDG